MSFIVESESFQMLFCSKIFTSHIIPYLDICSVLDFLRVIHPDSPVKDGRHNFSDKLLDKPVTCKRMCEVGPEEQWMREMLFTDILWSLYPGQRGNHELYAQRFKADHIFFFSFCTYKDFFNRGAVNALKHDSALQTFNSGSREFDAHQILIHDHLDMKKWYDTDHAGLIKFSFCCYYYCRSCLLQFIAKWEPLVVEKFRLEKEVEESKRLARKLKAKNITVYLKRSELEEEKKRHPDLFCDMTTINVQGPAKKIRMMSLSHYFHKKEE